VRLTPPSFYSSRLSFRWETVNSHRSAVTKSRAVETRHSLLRLISSLQRRGVSGAQTEWKISALRAAAGKIIYGEWSDADSTGGRETDAPRRG
jgi:hypothetical protein